MYGGQVDCGHMDDDDDDDDDDDKYARVPSYLLMPFRDSLLQLMQDSRSDALPGSDDYHVLKILVAQKLGAWQEPTELLRRETVALLHAHLNRIVDCATIPTLPKLSSHLKHRLREVVDQASKALDLRIEELLQTERERPYTQNHYYTDLLIKMRNNALLERLAKLKDSKGNIPYEAAASVLASFGVGSQSVEEAAAVEVEFRLAAYLKVVSKRIIDQMPTLLNTSLYAPVLKGVGLLQREASDTLLESVIIEDSVATLKRQELQQKLKALRSAFDMLRSQSTGLL